MPAPLWKSPTTKALLAVSVLAAAGCASFQSEVNQGHSENAGWKKREDSIGTVYTSADVRLVTERVHPVLKNTILCSEPSPDAAKALSTENQLSAKAANSTDVGVGFGTAESVAQLEGRTAGLVALRDGIYRSCEAYANGSLGADVYTLVAGKYTQLLSTLLLAQDLDATPISPAIVSPTVVLAPGSTSGIAPTAAPVAGASSPATPGDKSSSAAGGTTPGGSGPISTLAAAAKSLLGGAKAGAVDSKSGGSASAGNADKGTATPAGATAAPAGAAATPAGATGARNDESNALPEARGAASATSTGSAIALVRMNEDLIDVDYNLPALLFISCMNEYDPTRLQTVGNLQLKNDWLRKLCDAVGTLDGLRAITASYAELVQKIGHPARPVELSASVASPATASRNTSSAPSPSQAAAGARPNLVLEAQTRLKDSRCDPGTLDGREGAKTNAAVRCYQQAHPPLKVTGVLDIDTLMALKLLD